MALQHGKHEWCLDAPAAKGLHAHPGRPGRVPVTWVQAAAPAPASGSGGAPPQSAPPPDAPASAWPSWAKCALRATFTVRPRGGAAVMPGWAVQSHHRVPRCVVSPAPTASRTARTPDCEALHVSMPSSCSPPRPSVIARSVMTGPAQRAVRVPRARGGRRRQRGRAHAGVRLPGRCGAAAAGRARARRPLARRLAPVRRARRRRRRGRPVRRPVGAVPPVAAAGAARPAARAGRPAGRLRGRRDAGGRRRGAARRGSRACAGAAALACGAAPERPRARRRRPARRRLPEPGGARANPAHACCRAARACRRGSHSTRLACCLIAAH